VACFEIVIIIVGTPDFDYAWGAVALLKKIA